MPLGPPKRLIPPSKSVSPEKGAALKMIAEMKYKIEKFEGSIQSILKAVPEEEMKKVRS